MHMSQPADLDQEQTATPSDDRQSDTFDATNGNATAGGTAEDESSSLTSDSTQEVSAADAAPEQAGIELDEPSFEADPAIAKSVDTEQVSVQDELVESLDTPFGSPEPGTEAAPVERSTADDEVVASADVVPDVPSVEGTPAETASESTDTPKSAVVHDEASDRKLLAEVAAAPHKVYFLNRVKKAVAAAGEHERAEPLKAVEAEILQEIATRTAAKESLCERAEALKDSSSWKATGDAFKGLFEEWKQVGAAGREIDDQLWARFNQARGAFNERRSKHFEEREVVWSANREQKEALCVEAESLFDSTSWKATADAIRDLQAKWKAVGSAGREKDEALWARFNTAKQKFFDNRTAAWEENRKRKEALVVDAESLKDSADWRTAGDAMKAMQTEWKNIGPAGREHEDELWSRFRAATQEFFDRRSAVFAERNQAERDNAAQKAALCQRAESLLYSGDALSASREAKDLQAQWKEIGPVPREQSEALWARFRESCDKIFANAAGERDRQQNEWHVRMKEALLRKREQLSSLRESITHDEANILRWRESLSTLKPGGKSEEIGKGLEDKILDVMSRIREKQERADDLRASITDIEAKLRE